MQQQDHVDVQLVQIGMVNNVLLVSEEEYGMQHQTHVYVQQEIGMVFHVYHVYQDRLGTQQVYHAHVQVVLIGTVYNVKHAQEIDFGILLLMIVLVELVTGMVLLVSYAQPVLIGVARVVLLAMVIEFGTQ
jgi:ABC-type polar amino acid transport system ATPase subunit